MKYLDFFISYKLPKIWVLFIILNFEVVNRIELKAQVIDSETSSLSKDKEKIQNPISSPFILEDEDFAPQAQNLSLRLPNNNSSIKLDGDFQNSGKKVELAGGTKPDVTMMGFRNLALLEDASQEENIQEAIEKAPAIMCTTAQRDESNKIPLVLLILMKSKT